tara:strand:+ start:2806 stop:4704 length:1899 start_codon:yes stop_codon:yes gene_type:complete
MSLLLTSSRQREFNDPGQSVIGIEKPFCYTNHMRSPLIIDANSEISVVSIKCQRNGTVAIDERGMRIGIYWGKELEDGEELAKSREPQFMVYASVPGGTYTPTEFANALSVAMNKVCLESFVNMNSVTVTTTNDAQGSFVGFKIEFIQNASAIEVKTLLTTIPTINDNNKNVPDLMEEGGAFTGTYDTTENFTWTPAAQTLVAGAGKCNATFYSHPLSGASGTTTVDFSAISGNFTIGLTRSLPASFPAPENYGVNLPFANDIGKLNEYDTFYDLALTVERTSTTKGDSSQMRILQGMSSDTNLGLGMAQSNSASYQTAVVPGDLGDGAGEVQKVKFERFGNEVKISLYSNKDLPMLSGTTVKTMTLASELLYLKIQMEPSGGTATIDTFTSGSATPLYSTNERLYGIGEIPPERNIELAFEQDYFAEIRANPVTTVRDPIIEPTDFDTAPVTKKTINASGGQDRNWVVALAYSKQYDTFYMEGSEDNSAQLGFNKSLLRQSLDKSASSTTNDIIFISHIKPSLYNHRNMFIRFNGLQQISYNTNTGSISKILYACPRFDVNGNDTGFLYFEPHERVYIDCNNTDKLVMSDLNIELVDINEQYVEDIVGTTQINFHIRQKEGFAVGRSSGRT